MVHWVRCGVTGGTAKPSETAPSSAAELAGTLVISLAREAGRSVGGPGPVSHRTSHAQFLFRYRITISWIIKLTCPSQVLYNTRAGHYRGRLAGRLSW